eukprot:14834514-Heterocapsa_arctica.AAC.1
MRERIEEARAYSLQMVKVLIKCLRRVWRRKRGFGDGTFRAAFEWPRNNGGWQQPGLAPLLRALPFDAEFDGCEYDVRDHQGLLLKKPWLVRTDMYALVTPLSRHCQG